MGKLKIDYVVPDRVSRDSEVRRKPPMPPMSISLLRAMTPPSLRGYDLVTRCHEEWTMGFYDVKKEKPDLLMLSALTTSARRAYQMIDESRETTSWQGRRVRTVMGGIHATALPVEAIHYADGVVRGETPPELLDAILNWAIEQIENDGDEKRVFEHAVDARSGTMERRPVPDRSWYNPKSYILPVTLQSSVGCPFDCSFCSVTYGFGTKQRHPDYADLEAEISQLPRWGVTSIIDDNFLPNSQGAHARIVCDILRRHKIRWVTELTALTLYRNWRELVPLFSRSGCVGLYIGVESLDGGMSKSADLATYVDLINCLHDHGIGVLGAFVFGVNDEEGPEVFEETAAWARKAKFDFAQFSINTPVPGARDYEDAVRNNLITDWNWDHYSAGYPVRRFKRISQDAMYEGLFKAYQWFYELPSLKERMLGQLGDMFLRSSKAGRLLGEFGRKRLRTIAGCSAVGLYLRGTVRHWGIPAPGARNHEADPNPNPLVLEQFRPGSIEGQYDAKLRMRELRGEIASRTAQILGKGIGLTVTGRGLNGQLAVSS